jgi:hypothetical protein
MYYQERQEKIEEAVFDSIEEIAAEFDLNVPFYPSIQCINKSTEFEDLNLPSYFEEDFDEIGKSFDACFMHKSCSIILGQKSFDRDYGEEATHFVHYVNSGIKKDKKNSELDFVYCLSEMLGYFGSMILGEERRNQYYEWPDPYSQSKEFKEFLPELKKKYTKPVFLLDHLIHQQGYCLGERLFYAYQGSTITKREITSLFKNNFSGKNTARRKFVELRKRLDWPINFP